MPHNFNRITALGFKKVGYWRIVNGQLEFDLDIEVRDEKNVLYAFVASGSLAYVGKTTQPLKDRLQRYKTPAKDAKKGGSTNIKNNKNIRERLMGGDPVDIHAFHTKEEQSFGGFQVNLAAALEDSLILELKPPWNGRASNPKVSHKPEAEYQAKVIVDPKLDKVVTRLTVDDFLIALRRKFQESSSVAVGHVDILSGELHREIGGYPEKGHSMPVCCSVMWREMKAGDEVLAAPPKGKGATLRIRYLLPR
ncbi:MAG: GIY-YIG nuclease family protein [Methylobacter sp.]